MTGLFFGGQGTSAWPSLPAGQYTLVRLSSPDVDDDNLEMILDSPVIPPGLLLTLAGHLQLG